MQVLRTLVRSSIMYFKLAEFNSSSRTGIPDPLSSRVTGPAAAYDDVILTSDMSTLTLQTKEVMWRHLHNSCDMTKWRVLPRSFNFPRGFFDLSNKLVPIRNTTLLSYVALPLFITCTHFHTYPMLQAHLSLSVQTMAKLVWPEHRYNYRYSVSTFVLAVSVIHDLVDSSRNCSGNLW